MSRAKQARRKWPPSITKDYHEFCIKRMPKGAIKADLTKHAPHNSYSPPMWYVDEDQKCVQCGAQFTFTAKEQQHWFEVLQIPIYVLGNRCAGCRRKRRAEIAAQKRHMSELAKRPKHPNEEFFRKKKG